MAAVVHHGGAGTTAAALRAGRPSVVVPHFADQFFWARQLLTLGAAPPPVRPAKLTVDVLADRLAEALQPRTVHGAAGLARRLAKEDGLSAAVAVIEGAADRRPG
jgi:sterol 3beta-glucosyltransferase